MSNVVAPRMQAARRGAPASGVLYWGRPALDVTRENATSAVAPFVPDDLVKHVTVEPALATYLPAGGAPEAAVEAARDDGGFGSSDYVSVLRVLISCIRAQLAPDTRTPTIFQPPPIVVDGPGRLDRVRRDHNDYYVARVVKKRLAADVAASRKYLRDTHVRGDADYPFDRRPPKNLIKTAPVWSAPPPAVPACSSLVVLVTFGVRVSWCACV